MEENKEQTNPTMYTIQFDELKYIKYIKMMIMHEISTKTRGYNSELEYSIKKINDINRLNILYEIIANGGTINVDSLDREDILILALYYVAISDINNVIKYYEKLIDDDKQLEKLFEFLVEVKSYDNIKKYAPMMLKRNLYIPDYVLIELQELYNSSECEEFERLYIPQKLNDYKNRRHVFNFDKYCEVLGKKCIAKMIRYSLITNSNSDDFISNFFLSFQDRNKRRDCEKMIDILDDIFDDTMINMISQLSHDEVKTKCKLVQIIHRLIHNQFDIMNLHFNYTMDGKGYNDAKKDFLSHAVYGKNDIDDKNAIDGENAIDGDNIENKNDKN